MLLVNKERNGRGGTMFGRSGSQKSLSIGRIRSAPLHRGGTNGLFGTYRRLQCLPTSQRALSRSSEAAGRIGRPGDGADHAISSAARMVVPPLSVVLRTTKITPSMDNKYWQTPPRSQFASRGFLYLQIAIGLLHLTTTCSSLDIQKTKEPWLIPGSFVLYPYIYSLRINTHAAGSATDHGLGCFSIASI